jgi:hypothetical protein
MSSRAKKAAKAVPFNSADIANITKANPYIQRLIDDADLRDNVRTAMESSKSAYERLAGTKAPHKALLDDKKLHGDLRHAAEAIREATLALSDAPKHPHPRKKKGLRLGRKILFLVVAAVVALAVSEKLRSKVLDTLFGAEEEFQYTPPAGTPAPPPASPVTAA